MKTRSILLMFLAAAVLLAGGRMDSRADDWRGHGRPRDILYVTDNADNTVKRFDACTGRYLDADTGPFVAPGSGGLLGPRGIVFDYDGDLLVNNNNTSNVDNIFGEVLRYDGKTGAFLNALVPSTSPFAPGTPDGIIVYRKRGRHHGWHPPWDRRDAVIVADNIFPPLPENCPPDCPTGRLLAYDAQSGALIRQVNTPAMPAAASNPRGVVLGADGKLYVSTRGAPLTPAGVLGGHVLRYDPDTFAFLGRFIDSDSTNNMHRPDGLTFGPDGNLYVTSFRADANDTDKILIFNGRTGAYLDKIDLDEVNGPRAFAQAIVFGPAGKRHGQGCGRGSALFVPIAATGGVDSGQVRRYDVNTKTYDVFVPSAEAGGPLGNPWGLTFGNTNPTTLAYEDDR